MIARAMLLATLLIPVFCKAAEVSTESKNLSRCQAIYSYAARYILLMNNEGAAKEMLFRTSQTVTALFFLNLDNGVVSGDKLGQFKEAQSGIKNMLDTGGEDKLAKEISACDKSNSSSILKARHLNIIWDGKDFNKAQQFMLSGFLANLGIK